MHPQQIIRNYYVIAGLYILSASLIWGVNTLFLLDSWLNIFEVFIANAFFSAGMTLFEIPTGVLADTRGRRLLFLLSTLVFSLGTLGYVGIALFHGGLLWFCIMSFIQTGFLYWGFYDWQPYFLDLLGRDVAWVAGVIAALVSLATMAGNRLVEWLTQFCGERTTLMLWAAGVGALATVGVGAGRSFWLIVPLFLVYMATTGIITPVLQAYLHQVIPSGQRAAIVSLSSMVGSGRGILGQAGLGYLARVNSIASGYIAGGIASLVVLLVAGALRRLGDPVDKIAGKAGRKSACAAQGIPDISAVDTTTS